MTATAHRPIYMVDTCSFLELPRRYPRPHFDPVWDLIDQLAIQNRLCSVEDVALELKAQDDAMALWAEQHKFLFLKLSKEIQMKAREILAAHPTLVDLKRKKSSADPFLIAAAIVRDGVVVTEEKRSGGPPVKKIPDVCAAYTVPCIALLTLLQQERLSMKTR